MVGYKNAVEITRIKSRLIEKIVECLENENESRYGKLDIPFLMAPISQYSFIEQ